MRRRLIVPSVALLVASLPFAAGSAELGRHDMAGARTAPGVEKSYQAGFMEGGAGMEFGLNWNSVSWDVGRSYSDQVWAPQASFFYGVSDMVDIRATVKVLSMSDEKEDQDQDGQPEKSGVDVVRLGVGSKVWFNTGTDFFPFAGVALNYYLLNTDEGSGEEGMFGLSAEAGVAYMLNEWVSVQIGLQGETSVMDGNVEIKGESEDVSLNALGLGLALNVIF